MVLHSHKKYIRVISLIENKDNGHSDTWFPIIKVLKQPDRLANPPKLVKRFLVNIFILGNFVYNIIVYLKE